MLNGVPPSTMILFTVLLVLFNVTTTASISLIDQTSTGNRNLLPASRLVTFEQHHVRDCDRLAFERAHLTNASSATSFSSLLRRRDGINIYGKDIVHESGEPNYATLELLRPEVSEERAQNRHGWEATLLLTPIDDIQNHYSEGSCFVAMNRFNVKKGCEVLFEQRWAERHSKLASQPGFLAFSLLRREDVQKKRKKSDIEIKLSNDTCPFNYSTCTLWSSYKAWERWRNGEGRYSHEASRNSPSRTLVSEWLEQPASPIFWDGIRTILSRSGL
jgi:heme-degrading monooxygenase HmoA